MRIAILRVAAAVAGLAVLAVIAGAGYEMIGRRDAARAFPPPGAMVDIGGRRIQLDCRGTGTPVVVFESGLDMNGSLSWAPVHDSIARTTRACAYSRAGIMWSDPAHDPRTGKAIAEDLHATLAKAGEAPPFVLVGHSMGGPDIMTYTKLFGAEVAGLVFVDASHPEQVTRFSAVLPLPDVRAITRHNKMLAALSWTGLPRALLSSRSGTQPQPDRVRAAAAYAPTSLGTMLDESDATGETLAEAGAARQLGDRPLFVLTAMAPYSKSQLVQMRATKDKGRQYQDAWKQMHDEEASWSSRSQHQVVPDAGHYIQRDRPDVVIAAVRSVVDSVRAGR